MVSEIDQKKNNFLTLFNSQQAKDVCVMKLQKLWLETVNKWQRSKHQPSNDAIKFHIGNEGVERNYNDYIVRVKLIQSSSLNMHRNWTCQKVKTSVLSSYTKTMRQFRICRHQKLCIWCWKITIATIPKHAYIAVITVIIGIIDFSSSLNAAIIHT